MLTSVAYTPGRAPGTKQQFESVCLPHTIFTLYKKTSAAAGMGPSFSRSGCVSRSALERVCFLAISTSAKRLWGDKRHAVRLKEGKRNRIRSTPPTPAVGGGIWQSDG